MSVVAESTREAAEELRSWLINDWKTDSLHAVDASLRFDEDSEGEDALYLIVTIPVPNGMDTWPREEMVQLRRALRNHVAHGRIPRNVYLVLRPNQEEPQPGDEGDAPPVEGE